MKRLKDIMEWISRARLGERARPEEPQPSSSERMRPGGSNVVPFPARWPRAAPPKSPRGLAWRASVPRRERAVIALSQVKDVTVFDREGRASGEITDLALERRTGQVAYALVSFGGFLGLRSRLHPIPWGLLHYDVHKGGYVIPLTMAEIDEAPSLTIDELELCGATEKAWRARLAAYYNPLLPLGMI